MEQKLREYRALRRRKEFVDSTKEKLEKTKQKVFNFLVPKFFTEMAKDKKDEVLLMGNSQELARGHNFFGALFLSYSKQSGIPSRGRKTYLRVLYKIENEELPEQDSLQFEEPVDFASEASELESFEDESKEPWRYFIIKWTIYTIIWVTLYAFFLMQGFGAVFFALSVLIGICLNTSTKRKRPGQVSAYSVFNRNCKSIDGTLKAEELQRQMMFGMGGMRLV